MISFSISDYIALSVSALIYGSLFSVFECFVSCFLRLCRAAICGIYSAFFYNGSLFSYSVGKMNKAGGEKKLPEVAVAVRTVLFTLGFIILSFAFMDGQIRTFALCLALTSYLPLSKYITPYILRAILYLGTWLIKINVIIVRIATYIPRRIILALLSLFGIICKYFKQNNRSCKLISIDKTNKK